MEFQPTPSPSPESRRSLASNKAAAPADGLGSSRQGATSPSATSASANSASDGSANGKGNPTSFANAFGDESGGDEIAADQPGEEEAGEVAPPRAARGISSGTAPAKLDPTKADAANFDVLFAQWKETGDSQIRERLILSQRSMVIYLARRFMDRGEMFEDVMQIGMVGLINALDGFDHTRGIRFSTFAIPSISGEIRRYFRDKVWGMRVPRRMQELYSQIQNRIDDLTQKLDRSPTYAEIAIELGVEVEEVVETMEMGSALDPQSLDDTVYGEEGTSVADTIGGLDPDLVAYEEHASLQMALGRLTEKERKVLEMAYFDGYSQADIARQMGVSQMHISRLLRRSLTQLRHLLEEF